MDQTSSTKFFLMVWENVTLDPIIVIGPWCWFVINVRNSKLAAILRLIFHHCGLCKICIVSNWIRVKLECNGKLLLCELSFTYLPIVPSGLRAYCSSGCCHWKITNFLVEVFRIFRSYLKFSKAWHIVLLWSLNTLLLVCFQFPSQQNIAQNARYYY